MKCKNCGYDVVPDDVVVAAILRDWDVTDAVARRFAEVWHPECALADGRVFEDEIPVIGRQGFHAELGGDAFLYVDQDSPRALLIAWAGDMPMGGWAGLDDDGFRAIIDAELDAHDSIDEEGSSLRPTDICIRATVAGAVLRIRMSHGWSQERLARELGTTQQQVSDWERGKCRPSGPMVAKLCQVAFDGGDELLAALREED